MIKAILVTMMVLVATNWEVRAQKPQFDLNIGGLPCQPCWSFGAGSTTWPPSKIQTIFFPSDFPSAPSGLMKNIYFRVGHPAVHGTPSIYYNWTVKIGYTSRNRFNGTPHKDTFFVDLPVVFSASTFILPGADTVNKWIKIPLSGNFFYDKSQNFVVELLQGPGYSKNGIDLNAEFSSAPRTLRGPKDSATATFATSAITDFGFDIATTGVDDVRNIVAFGLFPNPVFNGTFNISFDAALPVKEVMVTITDAAGRQIFVRRYYNIGTSFFKEINMSDAPKGVYFIEILADGDRLTRRVVMQ